MLRMEGGVDRQQGDQSGALAHQETSRQARRSCPTVVPLGFWRLSRVAKRGENERGSWQGAIAVAGCGCLWKRLSNNWRGTALYLRW